MGLKNAKILRAEVERGEARQPAGAGGRIQSYVRHRSGSTGPAFAQASTGAVNAEVVLLTTSYAPALKGGP